MIGHYFQTLEKIISVHGILPSRKNACIFQNFGKNNRSGDILKEVMLKAPCITNTNPVMCLLVDSVLGALFLLFGIIFSSKIEENSTFRTHVSTCREHPPHGVWFQRARGQGRWVGTLRAPITRSPAALSPIQIHFNQQQSLFSVAVYLVTISFSLFDACPPEQRGLLAADKKYKRWFLKYWSIKGSTTWKKGKRTDLHGRLRLWSCALYAHPAAPPIPLATPVSTSLEHTALKSHPVSGPCACVGMHVCRRETARD